MSSQTAAAAITFTPVDNLAPGSVGSGCRACVTIPARNEEATLAACLDAFASQRDTLGNPLPPHSFEVLLLLNNCTDASGAVVRAWKSQHPVFKVHVIERTLQGGQAHVGWARRLLMDTAWQRLAASRSCGRGVILSTDADSVVAPDWIARNLSAIDSGADAVGGAICLQEDGIRSLPAQVQTCYRQDRHYAELVAQLDALLDPQAGDPWPRHADHYGSSLACTVEAYTLAGGMPPASQLEDEAFVDALRRADLCLRHDPAVRVYTSARLQGRAQVGLAGQLRLWSELSSANAHQVQSAAYLAHRFTTLARLRKAFATSSLSMLSGLDAHWTSTLRQSLRFETTVSGFFTAIDCDALIRATFQGVVEEPIRQAIECLEARLLRTSASVGLDSTT